LWGRDDIGLSVGYGVRRRGDLFERQYDRAPLGVRSCYAGAKAVLKKTNSLWLQPEEGRSKKAVKGKDE
jgi:hypothetical protein